MLSAAKTGRFDVLLAESLDRLSRRLADTAHLYDDLSFNQVRIVTKDQGEITKMHVAMLGMVAEQFISDLRAKTRRGQRGRIEAGRSAGGLAFGYTVLPDGDRVIEEAEAETVRRIFRDYAAGVGPRELAASLNRKRIPGPGGRPWKDTTIRGQRERGTGLLNNELYVGRLVWGRTEYRKNPSTGKRVARTIHQSELVIKDRPDLRIVSDDLWQAVRRRQEASFHAMPRDNNGNALNRLHRKTHVLSGLIRCGVCHGPMAITAKGRYGCSTYRANRGCSNSKTIPREHVEERVLSGLKQRLFNSELVGEFIDEFQKQVQRSRKQQIDAVKRSHSRLKELDSMIEKLVDTIAAGLSSPSVLDRLTMLEREKADLRDQVGTLARVSDIVQLPNMGDIYRRRIDRLIDGLGDSAVRQESIEIIQSMIESVVVTPRSDSFDIDVVGEIGAILALVDGKQKLPDAAHPGSSLSVVAGAGFEPAAFRL